jgi:lipopolysaccharide export system permease protein
VEFLNLLRQESRMGLLAMRRYIQLLDSQGKDTSALAAQMHVRLSLPLGAIAIALVLCAHVIRPTSQGVFWGFGGGLALVVVFYFMFFALKGATEISSQLGAGVGAWATNVLYALLGAVLLWRNAR